MDVVITLDTEDWVTPEAAHAQLWWPKVLTERGIRGSFQCVGRLLQHLAASGREDILDALRGHELGYHTHEHSVPPTHPEGVQGLDLADGVRWVRAREAEGLAAFRKLFGRDPISYTTPGDSWTAPSLLAMAAEGAKVCPDGMLRWWTGETYWYCGLLHTQHGVFIDEFLDRPDGELALRELFLARAAMLPEQGVLVLATHPTRLVTADFWDRPFYGAAQVPLDELPPAPLRSTTEIRGLEDRVRRWLDWLLARPDVRLLDFETVYRDRLDPERSLAGLMASAGVDDPSELPSMGGEGWQLRPGDIEACTWEWLPLPADLDQCALRRQAQDLLWTSGPREPRMSQ